ncbi:hypothetical protein A2867_00905 [Candidatus Daviesbacteria bacterium RIFCSPHIGHO2_01_FULL_40_11]|uniref:Uncharacterized protein n=1 Tax=Candidatus Daviesbacteria bacterium RIFCSPHIGHO2_01_FULL_40_11 TaxID=1797762 RepID=A0A1F5JLN1_9BACT|nr:MAG: hypothetical protein A2867_00905 [Candidatus Daviesbacteria bacterium RIFCSPHIGHO2_01_FULL_40_11]
MTEALLVREITLNTRLEDISDGPPCMACGYPTEKFLAPEHLMTGQNMQVRALNVASYRCNRGDGEVYRSHEAMVESLTKASKIMRHNGDDVTPRHFRESIRRYRKDIRDQRLTRPRNIL